MHSILTLVSAFQVEHGIKRRDPMSVTMAILLDIEHRASELTDGGASSNGGDETRTAAAIEAEVVGMIGAESRRFSENVFNLTVEGGSTNKAAIAAATTTKAKL